MFNRCHGRRTWKVWRVAMKRKEKKRFTSMKMYKLDALRTKKAKQVVWLNRRYTVVRYVFVECVVDACKDTYVQ